MDQETPDEKEFPFKWNDGDIIEHALTGQQFIVIERIELKPWGVDKEPGRPGYCVRDEHYATHNMYEFEFKDKPDDN